MPVVALDCHGPVGGLGGWLPWGELREQRAWPRTWMRVVQQRMRLKNRIHAALAMYGLILPAVRELFGRRGRQRLQEALQAVPPHPEYPLSPLLAGVDALDQAMMGLEQRRQAGVRTARKGIRTRLARWPGLWPRRPVGC